MPKRQGCPGPGPAPGGGTGAGGGGAHPGVPEGRGWGARCRWPCPQRGWQETGEGHQGWGAAGGQRFNPPPSLADPKESQRPQAHECLGEALRVLRQVINKYPLLNTLETLTAAGTLISKVKGEPRGLRAPAPSLLPWVGMGGPGEPIWGLPHGWGEGIDSRDPAPHPPACPTVGSAPAPCPPPRAGLPGVGVCVLRAVQCQK